MIINLGKNIHISYAFSLGEKNDFLFKTREVSVRSLKVTFT